MADANDDPGTLEPKPPGRTAQGDSASSHPHDPERLRLLVDNMLEGYAYCQMLFDDEGRPDDFVYIDVNRAFYELTGLSEVLDRRVTQLVPGIRESNPEIFEIYGRVTKTGSPEQFETTVAQLDMVLNISVFRPEPDHFVAVFEDITERKRAEEKLEELVRFLEFRLEQRSNDLAEALRIVERSGREGEEA